MQRVQVRSLVGELRSYMSHSQKKQNLKQTQYCDKFNKDLKKKNKTPPTNAGDAGDSGSALRLGKSPGGGNGNPL